MISRASLFNKGIYKSTVKRNIWGSVLYFIIIFLFSSMPLISRIDNTNSYYHTAAIPAVYRDSLMQPPVIVAIIVASIVAMLVYRFIHSKKTSVFVHSLPVGRVANYSSTLAAAFTLMAMPVVANGIILMILSLTAYSGNFGITHCLVWMGLNILCQVIMFSVATFASMITGNTIASAVLTLIIHVSPIIAIGCVSVVSGNFLHGYSSDSSLLNNIIESNPAVWIVALASQMGNKKEVVAALAAKIPAYIIGAAVVYVLSLLLYKKRGMETAEDVAAFGILNPVYKYFITFIGTLGVYSVFNNFFYTSPVMFTVLVVALSAVIYFACEMVLKKSLRVWKSYKGYLAFALGFGVMISIFAFTSFFGFETRVPETEDVEKVAIYNYYYGNGKPYVDKAEIIEFAVDTHKEMLSDIPVPDRDDYDTRLHIEYVMKNGRKLVRAYQLNHKDIYPVLSQLYKHDEYIVANEDIFRDEEVNRITLSDSRIEITDKAKANELLECVKKDILSMKYNEYRPHIRHFSISLEAAFEVKEDNTNSEVAVAESNIGYVPEVAKLRYVHESINTNYTNTINWLKENGYGHLLELKLQAPLYIVDNTKMPDDVSLSEYIKNSEDKIVVTDNEKAAAIEEYIINKKPCYDIDSSYDYGVYMESGRILMDMNEEEYREILEIIK